jgi:hypothetical protein
MLRLVHKKKKVGIEFYIKFSFVLIKQWQFGYPLRMFTSRDSEGLLAVALHTLCFVLCQ